MIHRSRSRHRRAPALLLLAAALAPLPVSAQTPAAGYQLVACIVAPLEGNTRYFGAATTATKLKCEFTNPDYHPTLAELYAQGWRLIEVVGGNHAIAMGNSAPSPLYLLERPAPAPAADAKPEPRKK